MDKKQFMDELKNALEGNVSYDTYKSNIDYYDDYFETKKRSGMTEEEIAASLGSGRVIAKTIIDAERKSNGGQNIHYDNYDKEKKASRQAEFNKGKEKVINNPVVQKILAVVIFILIVAVVIALVVFSLQVIWKVIVPIVLAVALVLFIIYLISYFTGRRQ